MRLATWTDTGTGAGSSVNHYDGSGDSPAWTQTTPSGGSSTWTRDLIGPNGQLGILSTGSSGSSTAASAVIEIINPHGDVLATVPDTAGATATSAAADYDEYGNPVDGAAVTYGWIGGKQRLTNPGLGVLQMGVRSYNPATGQFASIDPVYGGNPTPYGYPTNPVTGYDTSGKMGGGLPGFAWCAHHRARCSFGPSWIQKHWKGLLATTAIIVIAVAGVYFTGGLAVIMFEEFAPAAGLFANITMFGHFGLITAGFAAAFLGPTWVLLKHIRDGE